uniref:Uncharacterized protein n=1 Tax=Arundo donax TaxID=35708 RepID=A0A0A8ZF51_ARUDO
MMQNPKHISRFSPKHPSRFGPKHPTFLALANDGLLQADVTRWGYQQRGNRSTSPSSVAAPSDVRRALAAVLRHLA